MSDAITRKEAYLKSIANGTSSALKPITREEQYLAYIAGESKSFPTTPITREEAFLDKIAKSGVSGGSSINVQPLNATENGTWDAPEGQAYDPVTVDVKPITEPITITENGVYPVPKGGGLEFGKEYKFKDVITEEDFQAYIAASNGGEDVGGMRAYVLCDAVELAVMPVDTNNVYMVSVLTNGAENVISYVLGGSAFGFADGWQLADKTPTNAPTITVAEHAKMSADLATTAIFFDIETKSLDGWGEITVNVAGGGGDIVFPNDNKTHLLVSIKDTRRMPIPFNIYVDGEVVIKIDWGDGNTETFPFTTNWVNPKHTYANVGDYVVTIEKTWGEGQYKLGNGYDTSAVIGGNEKGGYYTVLKKAHIGQGTTTLHNGTFAYCMHLESVSMEDNITTLGNTVFTACESLKEIIFSNGITSLSEDYLSGRINLKKVVFPNKLTSIPNSLCYSCATLEDVTMGDTITNIGTSAFYACRCLRDLVMPASLTSIGDNAFNYCEGVKTYDFSKCTSVPVLGGTRVFYKNASDIEILVPFALYDEWKVATNWATHASKIKAV